MQDFRQAYRTPESLTEPPADGRLREVELAKPWQRLLAGAIDRILPLLFVALSMTIAANPRYVRANLPWLYNSALVLGGLTVLLLLCQAVIMSLGGQSIGQKILRIRLITDTGANPGFVKYVLVRELLFFIILLTACTFINQFGRPVGSIVYYVVQLAYLVMLCRKSRNYQTPQDMLLQTLVVKA
ncbi:RDD family protein [Eikenella sp. S3360]|uniref:RDD family protein n=1 Tax=Eikenella glucosivorans TaxID=2766967 RepID=A0ABS0NB26_9NEIS|nr:RDD family protein [Eikenella glucosivorans]MBH5329519.1 RDD family protein [Eikenella glucosivorans]